MANKIQFKRGKKAQLPVLSAGEPAVCLDTKQVFVGTGNANVQLVTSTELSAANHTHSNKSVLDDISAANVTGWDGKADTVTYTATLTVAGWTAGTAPYAWKQTVNVSGVLAADTPVVGILLQGTTGAAVEAEQEASGMITRITTAAGSIMAMCLADKPVTAVKLQLKVVR